VRFNVRADQAPTNEQVGGKDPEMMLKDKVAVIYEAGGAFAGAVTRAFALEGRNAVVYGGRRNRERDDGDCRRRHTCGSAVVY
jgi:hypothetical protein